MTTPTRIDLATVKSWNPCYLADGRAELLDAMFAEPLTPREILTCTDGPWEGVSVEDRLWVVFHDGVLPDKLMRLFSAWCARTALESERAAGREPTPRSWSSCHEAELFANGKATAEELVASWISTWVAESSALSAWGSAKGNMTAASPERAAKRCNAWADAWEASFDAQRDHMLAMMREYGL